MKSSVCGLVLCITLLAGCQPSRILSAFNRPKEPVDRFGFDDDEKWTDDDFDRAGPRDRRTRSRGDSDRVARMIARAKMDLKAGSQAKARRGFEEVLRIDRTNADAHHHLAMIADQRKEFRTAEKHYEAAYRKDPRNPHLLCNIGYSYYLQGNYRRAENFLRKALREDPNHKRALYNIGALYGKQGDVQAASRYFRKAGASSRETADLIADLQTGRLGDGVRTVGGSDTDRDSRFGAPAPGSNDRTLDRKYDPAYIKRMMDQRRREAETARRDRMRSRRNDDMGRSNPWRADDDRRRPSEYATGYGSRRDPRDQRSTDRSPRGGLTEDQIRRRLEADDRNSTSSYGPPGRGDDERRTRPWKDASYESNRRPNRDIQIIPKGQYDPSRGLRRPPADSHLDNNDRRDPSGDERHLWPPPNGDARVGSSNDRSSDPSRNPTAQLPPGQSSFDGNYRRDVTERDRDALRLTAGVGFGTFPTPSRGSTGDRSHRGTRDASYTGRRGGGVNTADYHRDSRGSGRPRYTQFSRGSDQRRGEPDAYSNDRRDAYDRGSRDNDIKVYPRGGSSAR